MTDEVKLCKDCVHFRWKWGGLHMCAGLDRGITHLVTGNPTIIENRWSCDFHRTSVDCGQEAKMFQQDPSPDFFQKYLT